MPCPAARGIEMVQYANKNKNKMIAEPMDVFCWKVESGKVTSLRIQNQP